MDRTPPTAAVLTHRERSISQVPDLREHFSQAAKEWDRARAGAVASEATPELRALLLRRQQLSEGAQAQGRASDSQLPGMTSAAALKVASANNSQIPSQQHTPSTRYRCVSPPQLQAMSPTQTQTTPRTSRRSLPENRVRRSTVGSGMDRETERPTGMLNKATSQYGCSMIITASDAKINPASHYGSQLTRMEPQTGLQVDSQRGKKAWTPAATQRGPVVHAPYRQQPTVRQQAKIEGAASSRTPTLESRQPRYPIGDIPTRTADNHTALWSELERLRRENAELQAKKEDECSTLRRQNERLAERAREECARRAEAIAGWQNTENKNAELEETLARQAAGLVRLESMEIELEVFRRKNEELTGDVEELRRERESEVDALIGRIAELEQELRQRKEAELSSAETEVATLKDQVARLEKASVALVQDNLRLSEELQQAQEEAGNQGSGQQANDAMTELSKENERLGADNLRLTEQLAKAQAKLRMGVENIPELNLQLAKKQDGLMFSQFMQISPKSNVAPEESPREGQGDRIAEQLRALLANPTASASQLRHAIECQESLLDEARREVAAKELRERRAAIERVHNAMQQSDETAIAVALAEGQRVGLDACDMEAAEAKLLELRSLSTEQRAAKAAKERKAQLKERAYMLAKRDDVEGLQDMLDNLEEDMHWWEWKDYDGRTLWHVAVHFRAMKVQDLLGPRLGRTGNVSSRLPQNPNKEEFSFKPDSDPKQEPPVTTSMPHRLSLGPVESSSQSTIPRLPTQGRPSLTSLPQAACHSQVYVTPAKPTPRTPGTAASGSTGWSPSVTPTAANLTPRSALVSELKVKAFRAVVKDDTASLEDVLNNLETDVWSSWSNKAGKDLLTLSQERGSSAAYAMLGKALGIIEEMKAEPFAEREAVWVFLPGEVQPRRASVMEDTDAEAPEVLLEYWDGDGEAEKVERCMVRKMWS
mmetsp:Transcript_25484/g.59350  ORF Transcript_25484/g.59350 Transcript_25484/m.59350 type:complete len:946 (-) Transcript_25484:176-3013(-)